MILPVKHCRPECHILVDISGRNAYSPYIFFLTLNTNPEARDGENSITCGWRTESLSQVHVCNCNCLFSCVSKLYADIMTQEETSLRLLCVTYMHLELDTFENDGPEAEFGHKNVSRIRGRLSYRLELLSYTVFACACWVWYINS